MNIRKIAVVGTFAAGAALALAPLSNAAPDPLTPVVDSEVASMNALFVSQADLAGVGGDVQTNGPQGFDIINPADVGVVQGTGATLGKTPFDFLMYGVNPNEAGLASDPGAYTEFNGALVNFDDAYNTELFSLMNPTAPIDTIPMADLFGSASSISEALATNSAAGAVTDFLTNGWNDLLGYFGIFAPA